MYGQITAHYFHRCSVLLCSRREQIKLWGSICVFVLVIVAVYTCLHRDVQWISSQTVQESLGIRNRSGSYVHKIIYINRPIEIIKS